MRMNRRNLLLSAIAGVALAALAAPAWLSAGSTAGQAQFESEAFKAAQAAGKPILVHVTAPWCGTCRAQKPIVAQLAAEPDFQSFAMFEVDFDTQKDALRRFRAQHQSTMVVFRGKNEVGRSIGETNREAIEALLRKAL